MGMGMGGFTEIYYNKYNIYQYLVDFAPGGYLRVSLIIVSKYRIVHTHFFIKQNLCYSKVFGPR